MVGPNLSADSRSDSEANSFDPNLVLPDPVSNIAEANSIHQSEPKINLSTQCCGPEPVVSGTLMAQPDPDVEYLYRI